MTKKILSDNWVANFLNYLNVEKNYYPLTLKSYAGDIALFEEFLTARSGSCQWSKVSILDIRAYLAQLNSKHAARKSIARRISSLRSFYKFLMRENLVKTNPFAKVRTPKLEKKLPVFLEECEINELLAQPDAT